MVNNGAIDLFLFLRHLVCKVGSQSKGSGPPDPLLVVLFPLMGVVWMGWMYGERAEEWWPYLAIERVTDIIRQRTNGPKQLFCGPCLNFSF